MISRCSNILCFSSFQTGHSALQRAAAEGHLEVVKHLVGRGAAVDHQDEVVSNAKKKQVSHSLPRHKI